MINIEFYVWKQSKWSFEWHKKALRFKDPKTNTLLQYLVAYDNTTWCNVNMKFLCPCKIFRYKEKKTQLKYMNSYMFRFFSFHATQLSAIRSYYSFGKFFSICMDPKWERTLLHIIHRKSMLISLIFRLCQFRCSVLCSLGAGFFTVKQR